MSTKIEQSTASMNKQFLHIAAECMVGLGLVFWISSKNKKLTSQIDELSQRIEDQEDQIQQLQNIVNTLLVQNSKQIPKVNNTKLEQQIPKVNNKVEKQQIPKVNNKIEKQQIPKVSQFKVEPKVVQFVNKIETIEEESETESDIDNEIRIELDELDIESNLKIQE